MPFSFTIEVRQNKMPKTTPDKLPEPAPMAAAGLRFEFRLFFIMGWPGFFR
jgi:hypothetical protein